MKEGGTSILTNRPKLRLNVRSHSTNSEGLSAAVEKRLLHKETFDEAWERLLSMKNSAADERRLWAVREAMEDGRLGRDPSDMFNRRGDSKQFSKAEALRLWQVLDEQNAKERLRKMVEQTPDNYWLIAEEERLNEFLALLDSEEEIVFDVETTGTDVWEDCIVGHVLTAVKADVHAYIPTKHVDPAPQLDNAYVNERLRPIYEDSTIGKIAHNAKFDIAMLDREGITLKGLAWDTFEAMKLLNENEMTYALKPLVTKYLRDESATYSELFGDQGFDKIPLDQALAYAAKDGDVTLRLRDFQRYHLAKMPNVLEYYETVEVPLIPVIADTEKEGYVIDLKFAEEYGEELRAESEEYGRRVFEGLGDINLNSPAQLKGAIETYIGKTIENTNAKQTLKPLAKEFPIIADLLKYRETTKLLSTYIDALPTLIKKKTGRLHAQFNQNGAKTGRFSSGGSGFNLQNQPRQARSMFVAPDGYYVVNADFAAQEVRIIASESGEEVLLDAFAQGMDAYASLASEFFDKPYEECYRKPDGSDTEERKRMKVVLLMSMYGASKYGLATALGISTKEAEQFLEGFFKKYRKIDAFIKRTQDFAKKNGFVWIGDKQRKRRLPDARKKREFIPYGKWNDPKYDKERRLNGSISVSMRQGPNAVIQGRAAIQTKETLIEVDRLAKDRGWKHFGAIHDEIIVLIPTSAGEEDYRELERVMTQTHLLEGVENGTDIEIQRRWGDSITLDEYLSGKEVPQL